MALALAVLIVLAPSSAAAARDEATPDAAELIRQGVALHDESDYAGALELYEKALEIDPDNPVALYEMAHTFAASGHYDACISAAKDALEASPPLALQAATYGVWGTCLSTQGKAKKAIRKFREGLEASPDDASLHFNIAITLQAEGEDDEAIEHLERAIDSKPGYSSPYIVLGELHRRNGRRVPGLLCFARFVSLEPNTQRSAAASTAAFELLNESVEETGPGELTVTVPSEVEDELYAPFEIALGTVAASMHLDEEQAKPDTERQVDALVTFMQITLELGQPGEEAEVLWRRVAGPLIELHRDGHFETLAYVMANRAGFDQAVEWLENHRSQLQALQRELAE